MERQKDLPLHIQAADAFAEPAFLQKLSMDQAAAASLFSGADWHQLLRGMGPIEHRIACADALDVFRPLLDRIAPEPAEGWLDYAYQVSRALLYPVSDPGHTSAQWDGALCFLHFLQVLLDAERAALPFDFWLDFDLCTEEELAHSSVAEEYRRFLRRFREEYIYEMLRLSREATPFRTLDHIAGVHHVAMRVARAFRTSGGTIDLGLISGAALGHDLGKFGCKPGERVPYLHYYYTDQWFTRRGLPVIGHIAANHSVWDLEIENLSSESLTLVYADFRVKQTYDRDRREIACLFTLQEAFDVILSKLDDVDDAKRLRYRYVYAKLRDFEDYLISFGVDVSLRTAGGPPLPAKNAALLTPDEVVAALRRTAVDHNIRLMHRLGREQLFGNTLEAARSEKDPARLQAYVSIFEEYFTYWNTSQKEQTLDFLYELLLMPDGDIRRRAAALIGRILAAFRLGYQKEPPTDALPDPDADLPFRLWAEYLEKFINPDRRLTPRQISMIRYQAKTAADALLMNCSDADAPRFAGELFRHYRRPELADADAAFALLDTVLSLPLDRVSAEDMHLLTSFAVWWLERGGLPQKAAALRLFGHLLTALDPMAGTPVPSPTPWRPPTARGSTPLLFLQARLGSQLGLDVTRQRALLDRPDAVSNVFLDNLKTATPWVLKAVGVEYLLDQVEQGDHANVLHIATHFSNLMKVSENIVVRRMAGASLLAIAPVLTPDRRNEIAVELAKVLETGQTEISQYIPLYLGQFALWLSPRELDEVVSQMQLLLSSANSVVVAASLATVGSMLEHYAVYSQRFGESPDAVDVRWRRLAGLLLKGLASYRQSVRQEALQILGERLFASQVLSLPGQGASLRPHGKEDPLPAGGAAGAGAELFLHRRRPLPHLPLPRLLSDRVRRLPLPHAEKGRLLPRHLRPLLPEPQGHRPGDPGPGDGGVPRHRRVLLVQEGPALPGAAADRQHVRGGRVRRVPLPPRHPGEPGHARRPGPAAGGLRRPGSVSGGRLRRGGQRLLLQGAAVTGLRPLHEPHRLPPLQRRGGPRDRRGPELHHRPHDPAAAAHLSGGHQLHPHPGEHRPGAGHLQPHRPGGPGLHLPQQPLSPGAPVQADPPGGGSGVLPSPQPDRRLWEELSEPMRRRRRPEMTPGRGLRPAGHGGPPRVLGFLTLRTINSGGLYEALGDTELANYVRTPHGGKIQLLTGLYARPGAAAATTWASC